MTPQFLRDEASRFRGMAETVEREASKQRLLAMAVDYEARAKAGDEVIERDPSEPVKPKVGRKAAGSPAA